MKAKYDGEYIRKEGNTLNFDRAELSDYEFKLFASGEQVLSLFGVDPKLIEMDGGEYEDVRTPDHKAYLNDFMGETEKDGILVGRMVMGSARAFAIHSDGIENITQIVQEKHDALMLAQIIVQRFSGSLTDAEALAAPLGLELWAENRKYDKGQRVRYGEKETGIPRLYEVMQDVGKSLANQAPGSEGTLALYRPIEPTAAGTFDDPIPFAYGMDCRAGLYYSYNSSLYLCKADMLPCVWYPGTAGLWQWEKIS